jgi:hypothetical protein
VIVCRMPTDEQQFLSTKSSTWNTWGVACRPTLLFVVAFALNITPHEVVHGITSYLLGFNSILFQMWVNPDAAEVTSGQAATIAASGPLFSLVMGIGSWLFYQRWFRRSSFGLMFLMLAIVGVYSFLGPVAGTAFGGDFHLAFTFLNLSKLASYLASAVGIALLPAFMFFMGKELLRWAPQEFGRAKAVSCTTVAPWLIGPLLLLLLYWPIPKFLIGSTLTGSVFWVFAVLGATIGFPTRQPNETISSLTSADLVLSIVALVMVRFFAYGIRLAH